jgi:hypothetical protein
MWLGSSAIVCDVMSITRLYICSHQQQSNGFISDDFGAQAWDPPRPIQRPLNWWFKNRFTHLSNVHPLSVIPKPYMTMYDVHGSLILGSYEEPKGRHLWCRRTEMRRHVSKSNCSFKGSEKLHYRSWCFGKNLNMIIHRINEGRKICSYLRFGEISLWFDKNKFIWRFLD